MVAIRLRRPIQRRSSSLVLSMRGTSRVALTRQRKGTVTRRAGGAEEVIVGAAQGGGGGAYLPDWQILVGFVGGLSPFVIAAYEFGKRILIQKRCERCRGSGLIQRGKYQRKCPDCGGFLPWQSWEQFLTSDPGNGGVLRKPKGQTSVFYSVPPPPCPPADPPKEGEDDDSSEDSKM